MKYVLVIALSGWMLLGSAQAEELPLWQVPRDVGLSAEKLARVETLVQGRWIRTNRRRPSFSSPAEEKFAYLETFGN